jgi:alpha-N-arabinofuranosidase
VLDGWSVSVHQKNGRDGVMRVDGGQAKEGKQSLLLEAEDPVALAAGQKLFLPVGTLWRLRGWVRTENLSATGATAFTGAIDVRTSAGSLGRTPSHTGTADWREESVTFRVASPGEVNVQLFHTGRGRGTGKVWFDDIRLDAIAEPARAQTEEVRITAQKLSRLPIDAKQGGQFIEPLCSLIPSLLAQQVNASSFEEEPPCKFAYRPEVDQTQRPWYPDGAVQVARYSYDTFNAFNGARSQKIEIGATWARAGISQDGFALKKGLRYRLRLHMRGEGNVEARAWLHAGGRVVANAVSLGNAGAEWKGAAAELVASADTDNATLTIDFAGPGTLWLDRVYMIGEDAVLGIWRPDVVAALRELHSGVIRFGGTAIEGYEWDRGIGPWDQRVPFTTWWGGLEPNFVGEEEFIQLCRLVGAEPLICMRWTGKTPQDAADQIEYFNGAATTKWGSLRAKNGHAEPYGVKYWQIGNEVGGAEYDASVKPIAEAMRKVDPSIRILSAFPSEQTLKFGAGLLDYLSPHHYAIADLTGVEREFAALQKQIDRDGAGRQVRVAVTEWNTTGGEWGLGRGMLQTLGNALSCARYHNLLQRNADLTEMAMRSNLANSFGSGVIMTGPGWLYLAPTYYAQQFYARAAGTFPLRVERAGDLPWHLAEPDLSATLSADGKTLRIYVVNSTTETLRERLNLAALNVATMQGTAHVLKDGDQALSTEIINSRDDLRRIAPVTRAAAVQGSVLEYAFEPLSLTLVELQLGK